MFNQSIIENFVKIGIKTWLKSICKRIDIHTLNLTVNKESFGKFDKIYLKANNLIYQDLYIKKIIINIHDCNLKFNYRNHLIYSEDIIINSFLTIDNKNLENIYFSKRWEILRLKIEKDLLGSQNVSNIFINNDLITFIYDKNKFIKEIFISLNLKDNLIFLENINYKNKISLPLDKNIKFNSFHIKNKVINIALSSKVIFDN